ncbi:MAG: ABC transporter ATP-binding protein [Promethearchaeota archaeon]
MESDTEAQTANSPKSKIPVIELTGLYKIFKQKKIEVMALRGIDLKVYPGELVVIMGPSGSGKTTLLNCISGIEKPNAGSIKIKNMEITKLRDEGIQKLLQEEIGIIFQSFNLIPSLTAIGNVELPMIVANKLSKKNRKAKARELLEAVNLEHRIHHRPSTLSGGEKQRLSIAMAFANDPALIIADEPTASVDSVSAESIMRVFKEFMKANPDKALIIVTHDPALRKIADYTLVIRDGQFVRRIDQKLGESEQDLEEVLEENDMITDMNKSRSNSETNLVIQRNKFPGLQEIRVCPHCHSESIIKKLDDNDFYCAIQDSQVIQRAAIFCKECNELSFASVRAFDLNKVKINEIINLKENE